MVKRDIVADSEEYLVEIFSLRDWRLWLALSACEVGVFGLRLSACEVGELELGRRRKVEESQRERERKTES